MVCYYPMHAFQSRHQGANGKCEVLFNRSVALRKGYKEIKLSCGQCVGCRLERSRQWAVRCMHEASLHKHNCFITLTFSPAALAARENPSLDVRDFQLFMKRYRKRFGEGIRFFHCGEYGDKLGRPHYHACIFGHDFEDKYFWRKSDSGYPVYRSPVLEELWTHGFSEIGTVTFDSAAYVARYIMKKVNGKDAKDHYTSVDLGTGEVFLSGRNILPCRAGPALLQDGLRSL